MAGETAARIGANFSDYLGNAALGGNTAQVFNIDTKPLENLAHYTYYYKRELWKQQQQDTDAKIKELADLSKISLNNLKGKDKEQATKEFADLQKYAAEYARKTPKTAQEKMQNELDWQVKYGAFNNNYNSGKTRAVSYYKRYNDIMAGTEDAKSKDAQIAILNKEFNDTDIATPISGVQAFKTQKFDVPDPTVQKFQSVIIGGNENIAIEGAVYNPKLNAGVADVAIIGIKKIYPQKGTPEYDKLSQSEKNQAEVQATVESGAKVWVDATEPLNQVLKGYIDADGNFDAQKFEDENASNITLMDAYNALKRYDSYNREKYIQAKSGVFNDKGLSVKLPPNLNPEDFKAGFVDFSKGVNANQLVQSGMFAKYQGDLFSKKVTETDNAIQRENLAAEWYRAKTGRITANKKEGSDKPLDVIDKPAIIFGQHIDRLKKRFSKSTNDITISFEATDDQTKNAIGLGKGEKVVYRSDGSYIIKDKAGKQRVVGTIEELAQGFINAVKTIDLAGSKDKDGTMAEGFQIKSENKFKEIFGTSSGKQIWDNWGTSQQETEGGSTTESSSSKVVTEVDGFDVNGFKKEGKYWRYKDGTLYDAKGSIVK